MKNSFYPWVLRMLIKVLLMIPKIYNWGAATNNPIWVGFLAQFFEKVISVIKMRDKKKFMISITLFSKFGQAWKIVK